jgi:hypothetical protein
MGILFNVVEDVVTEALLDDAWDETIDGVGVSGSSGSLGNHPDGDFDAGVEFLRLIWGEVPVRCR